jgi:hypothetical protein
MSGMRAKNLARLARILRNLTARYGLGVVATLAGLLVLSGCGSPQGASSSPSGFGMLASTPSANTAGPESAPALAELTLSEGSVVGGASTTITVTLSHPAPASGVKILLTSSEAAVVKTPSSLEIEGGQSSLSFTASTSAVTAAVPVTVSAQAENSIVGANLSVLPPASAPFTVIVQPAAVTVQQGKSGSATATTKINTGFNHSLQMSASGEPSGVSVSLNPLVIPAPGAGTSAMSISVASSVQTGSYPLTVTASEGTVSAAAKTTLNVISGTTNPNAKFKGCWYRQNGHRYQGVDISVGNPGTYPFNAILYRGATCNPNDFADQFGFGQMLNFGGFGYTFWFTDFRDRTNMSALWYVGSENSQCVNYATAPNC